VEECIGEECVQDVIVVDRSSEVSRPIDRACVSPRQQRLPISAEAIDLRVVVEQKFEDVLEV